MKKRIYILLLLLLTSNLAFGSGSDGGSGGSSGGGSGGNSGSSGGGSGGSSSGGGSGSSGEGGKSTGPDYAKFSKNYAIGKQIFFSQFHCASCPLADLPLEKESIASIMPLLKSKGELGRLLSYRNRYAVKYFLKNRFGIK